MSNQPKWQRARLVNLTPPVERFLIGAEVWAEASTIETIAVDQWKNGIPRVCRPQRVVEINVIHDISGQRLAPPVSALEFLARDENDFADDVPLISWKQFLAECHAKKESK